MILNTHKNSKYIAEDEYEVEKILDQRKESKRIVYLVKWKGYPHSENTWQPKENLRKATIKLKEWERRKLKMNLSYDDEEAQADKDSFNTRGTLSRKTGVKKQKVIAKRQKVKYCPTPLELDQYEKKLRNQKRVWEKSQYQISDNDEQKIELQQLQQQRIKIVESADSTKMENRRRYPKQMVEFGKETNQEVFNQESNFIAETSSLHRHMREPWMGEGREDQMGIKDEEEQNGSRDRGLEKVAEDRLQLDYSTEKKVRSLSYHGSNSCISQLLHSYCTLSINSPVLQFQNQDGRSNQQEFRQLSALLNQQRFGIEQLSDQINLIDDAVKNNEPDLFDYLKNDCGGLIDYDGIARIVKREKDTVNNGFYFLGEMKNGKMVRLQNYQELKEARPLLLLDYYQKIVNSNLEEGVIGLI